MERRILSYRRYMDELLEKLEKAQGLKNGEGARKEKSWTTAAIGKGQESGTEEQKGQGERNVDLEELKKEHLTQIGFALMEMLSLIMTIMSDELFPIILTILILVLLLPYIRHYYILENEVQKMYAQYDRISQLQNCNFDVTKGSDTKEE